MWVECRHTLGTRQMKLTRLGHDITVFTRRSASGQSKTTGFRVEPVLTLRSRYDRAIVGAHSFDLWHCMDATQSWLALETDPVFVTVHGNDFLSMYHQVGRLDLPYSDRFDNWLGHLLTKRLISSALPRARHIFTNSVYTNRILLKCFPRCRGKTSVASVGLDEAAFATHRSRSKYEPIRLITICRLDERRKNLPAVLEALSLFRKKYHFHYTIVGDGRLRHHLQELTCALGIQQHVTFAGYVTSDKKRELLRQSDLFLLPTASICNSYEGFGLVYLEANACGVPVLASRAGGAAEAVEEGVNGYFVETTDAQGIASALGRFIRGELTFDENNCHEFARRFSWGKSCDPLRPVL